MASVTIVQWVCQELSAVLGDDDHEDIATYILSIETKRDLEEYMCELLDPSIPRQRHFISQLLEKWRPPQSSTSLPNNTLLYKKNREEVLVPSSDKGSKNKRKTRKVQEVINLNPTLSEEHQTNGALPLKQIPYKPLEKHKVKQHNNKFVPLFSDDGKKASSSVKLPGRHTCECQASKHALVNNCVGCGRVVCMQEGSGPCLFCGLLVCNLEEMEVLARGSKKSDRLREKLMNVGTHQLGNITLGTLKGLRSEVDRMEVGLEKATQHKDKLLEYDRTSVKRTQVLDDESDYFNSNSAWLSDREKAKLQEREKQLREGRHASRLDRKLTLDFAGRCVVSEEKNVNIYDVDDDVIQEVHFGKSHAKEEEFVFKSDDFCDLVNPNIKQHAPKFVSSSEISQSVKLNVDVSSEKKRTMRLQDSDLQEMRDEGVCLSMHQPWAGLLVAGIKKHEGRTWYSPHRGRLWIAATAKEPTQDEIDACEHQYKCLYNDRNIIFPSAYPVACLLGCVTVKDVLSQETYKEQFSRNHSEESTSSFVFICENPQQLVLKQPMKGKHKIYKLDGKVHQGAKRGLQAAPPFHIEY